MIIKTIQKSSVSSNQKSKPPKKKPSALPTFTPSTPPPYKYNNNVTPSPSLPEPTHLAPFVQCAERIDWKNSWNTYFQELLPIYPETLGWDYWENWNKDWVPDSHLQLLLCDSPKSVWVLRIWWGYSGADKYWS